MLVHTTIASGVLPSNTDHGDLAHYKLYESITPSGTDIKSFIFHNLSGDGFIDARVYINVANASELHAGYDENWDPLELDPTNRFCYVTLPDYETAFLELGYLVHLKQGEALYGETDYPYHVNYYINGAIDEGCNTACPE